MSDEKRELRDIEIPAHSTDFEKGSGLSERGLDVWPAVQADPVDIPQSLLGPAGDLPSASDGDHD